MKKLVLVLAFSAFAFCGNVKGQIVQSGSNAEEVDSLKQVVSTLSARIDEANEKDMDQKVWKDRAKYFNIGIVKQSLTSKDDLVKYKSNIGVNLTWGKTYYLHKKPLFGMVKIGLDWSWMDFNYVKYSRVEESYVDDGGYDPFYDSYMDGEEDLDLDFGCHQLEYGMQIGPSITVNHIDHLKISTYFRFQPSGSVMLLDDEVYYGFVPFFNFGAAVAWKAISIGVEGRWGGTKYHGVSVDDEGDYTEESYDSADDFVETFTQRMRTKSFRAYVSFRF